MEGTELLVNPSGKETSVLVPQVTLCRWQLWLWEQRWQLSPHGAGEEGRASTHCLWSEVLCLCVPCLQRAVGSLALIPVRTYLQ